MYYVNGKMNRHAWPFADDNVHDAALLEIQTSLGELEELKQQHMAEFIAASKRELVKVWNMCFISEVQVGSLTTFSIHCIGLFNRA